MRVIASVYACAPDEGSEPGVGWNWVKACAKEHEVWAITRKNNQNPIEQSLSKNPQKNLHFHYIDLPDWAKFWKRGLKGIHLYYYLWQHLLAHYALKLHADINFDFAHHMTFVNDWMPSGLAVLNIPFVWGPVGHHPKPPECIDRSQAHADRSPFLRNVVTKGMQNLNLSTVMTRRRANIILAINQDIQHEMASKVSSETKVLLCAQNAVGREEIGRAKRIEIDSEKPFKIVFAGRMVSIKGPDLVIDAFAQLIEQRPNRNLECHFVGSGPLEGYVKKRLNELHLHDKVFLHGLVSREKVLNIMNESNIFVFPSAEGAGMVVLEAMAKGLPVVCLDYGGPGEYINESCGIRVRCGPREKTVREISCAMDLLSSDSGYFNQLSNGAIERIRTSYTWDHIAETMKKMYSDLMYYTN